MMAAISRVVPIAREFRASHPINKSNPPTAMSRAPAAHAKARTSFVAIVTPYISDANCGAAIAITPVIAIETPTTTKIAKAIDSFVRTIVRYFPNQPIGLPERSTQTLFTCV